MVMHDLKNLVRMLLLLFMIFGSSECTRDLGFHPQIQYTQSYAKVFGTLGVKCRCCDEASSDQKCKTKWEGSCSKLQCLPWKYHHHV